MKASRFISANLGFKGKMAVVSIAISFLIMITAVSVASGFRHEIRKGISDICSDVQLTPVGSDYLAADSPTSAHPSYIGRIEALDGVRAITPVIYRTGIVKVGDNIKGVMFKGSPSTDTTALGADIPSRIARQMGLSVGDRMLTYFVGEKVKARNFTVTGIHDSIIDTDAALIVNTSLEDLQRLEGWSEDQVSAIEIQLDERYATPSAMEEMAREIGSIALMYATEDDDTLVSTAASSRYSSLFSWLQLIDTNVLAILVLMTMVAGFNMVSGLLILLFRNISTIGILKTMGMTDRGIAAVFIRVAAKTAAIGMVTGNLLALLFCAVQGTTHLIRLNPESYFVAYVPVHVSLPWIATADLASFAVILLLMLLPSMFISKVDPADTVRVR